MNSIINFLSQPRKIVLGLCSRGFLRFISDEQYLKMRLEDLFGSKPDLENPRTFCEKLQWLKLHDRNPAYTAMVDKYEVKRHVAEKIGEQYIIPTIGVWDSFDEIDFDALPEQFVLKCTHDSGGLVICRDKSNFDMAKARQKINRSLKRNYYYLGREWPYKNVKPRIIAEKYMEDSGSEELKDYKFFCFEGVPGYCQVISDRSTNEKIDFFDMSWNHQPFVGVIGLTLDVGNSDVPVSKPVSFETMKELSQKLAAGIPFCRVDFYEVNGQLFFGEVTFYPASGFGKFTPDEWNTILGDRIHLP